MTEPALGPSIYQPDNAQGLKGKYASLTGGRERVEDDIRPPFWGGKDVRKFQAAGGGNAVDVQATQVRALCRAASRADDVSAGGLCDLDCC